MKKIYSCLGMMFLVCAHCVALSFTSVTSGNWNNPATWGLTGTPTVGVNFPGSSDDVTISASNTVTLTADAACNNITINVSAGLMNVGDFTLTVNGAISATSTVIPSNLINTNNGIVKFVGNARALFSTWAPSNINWRCEVALNSGQIGTCTPANKFGYLRISSGTFSITGELRIDSAGADGFGGIDIANNATLIALSNVGNRSATNTYCGFININGVLEFSNNTSGRVLNGQNINVNSGGILRLKRGGLSGTGGNALLITAPIGGVNFNYAAGSTLEYINNFNSSASGNFTQTGPELSQGSVVGQTNPSVYNLNFDAIGDNDIRLNSGLQVFGTVTMKRGFLTGPFGGSLIYQAGGTLKYNGSLTQKGTGFSTWGGQIVIYPTELGSGPTNLVIDNTAGVTFDDDGDSHLLPGTFTFTNGKITANNSAHPLILTESATVVGADGPSGKYVAGPLSKRTNSTSSFTFPIGTSTVYHPIAVQPTDANANEFKAQYFNANPQTTFNSNYTAPISGITNSEYWDVSHTSGTSPTRLTLTWSSQINGATLADIVRVAHFTGTAWQDYGSDVFTFGNATSGSVTSNSVTSFSPITLGFAPAAALPVKLISFSVAKQGSLAAISWKVADPQDAKRYEIYRSGDGQNYELLQTIAGDPNKVDFKAFDNKLLDGSNYYRLKVYDIDGSFYYSKIVVIFNNNKGLEVLGLSPNIIYNSANLSVTSSSRTQINIMVSDVQGKIVQRLSKDVMAGENSINLNFSGLPAGTYQLTTTAADGAIKTLRFMKL